LEDRVIKITRPVAFVLCVVGAMAFVSCGGSNSSSNPNPPTTLTPAPAPSPTPGAIPGTVTPKSCGGPAPSGGHCGTRPDPQLAHVLAQATDEVKNQKDLFYPDGITIRHLTRYRAAIVAALDARGICAIWDFGNRIGDNLYLRSADGRISEGYDAISGVGQPRIGYANSCEPAGAFPPSEPGYGNHDPSCALPPSGDTFCLGRSFDSDYRDDVRNAIVQVTTERPELFDMSDALSSDLSYKLHDPKAYTDAVVAKLKAKGYCAIEDEELLVKKDNGLSENFDIVRSPGDRPSQYSLFSYKGRCHNATF
jgi:hypothetical protein